MMNEKALSFLSSQGLIHFDFLRKAQLYLDNFFVEYSDFIFSPVKLQHSFLNHFPAPGFVRHSLINFEKDFHLQEEAFVKDITLAHANGESNAKILAFQMPSLRSSNMLPGQTGPSFTKLCNDLREVSMCMAAEAQAGLDDPVRAIQSADLLERFADLLTECLKMLKVRVCVVAKIHSKVSGFLKSKLALSEAQALLTQKLRFESENFKISLTKFLHEVVAFVRKEERQKFLDPRFVDYFDDKFNHFFHQELLYYILRFKSSACNYLVSHRAFVGEFLKGDSLMVKVSRTPFSAMKNFAKWPKNLLVQLLILSAKDALIRSDEEVAELDRLKGRCQVLALPPMLPFYQDLLRRASEFATSKPEPPAFVEVVTLVSETHQASELDFGKVAQSLLMLHQIGRGSNCNQEHCRELIELFNRVLRYRFLFEEEQVKTILRGYLKVSSKNLMMCCGDHYQGWAAHLIDLKNAVSTLHKKSSEFCSSVEKLAPFAGFFDIVCQRMKS